VASLAVFWDSAIEPLLEAASPKTIVEAGVFRGETTTRLLEFASRSDCVVHAIDPAPGQTLDLAKWQEKYGERFVFHRQKSLEALHAIEAVDVALIDGDHNWYTVYNELTTLAARAESEGRTFPLTLLHDVDWPYGRRDLYHDPESIPVQHRRPAGHGGLVPGQVGLSETGGMNLGASHALLEGTERNGVRTALEDFVSEAELALELRSIVGFHGLAILVARERLAANARLRTTLEHFESAEWLRAQCERIEHARLALVAELQQAERQVHKLERIRERLKKRLGSQGRSAHD